MLWRAAKLDNCFARAINKSAKLLLFMRLDQLAKLYQLNNKKGELIMLKKFKVGNGFKALGFGPLLPIITIDSFLEICELRLVDIWDNVVIKEARTSANWTSLLLGRCMV